jgi:outer membrane protein TolC
VSQLIFSGEYIVGLQAARVYKELSQKSYAKSEVTTKESIASSYSILLVLEENIKVLKESIKTLDQSLTEVSGMNQQGFVEETDVDQLKINRANVQTMINSIEGQKNVATKLLQIQLGINFDQPVELTDSIPAMVTEGNLQYLSNTNFNVENSIDYEMMKTQEGLSLLSLRRQKSTLLPTVSGFYRHTELLNEPVLNFQPKDIIGVSVSFPIFTSGQRISRINQAKLDLEKTRLSKEDVGQSLIMEFESARNDYETAFRNFTSNKESMELSSKIYNRTLIKYREGVSSSLELTQTQGQYLTSQSNYFNSVLSLLNAKTKLDRILTNYQN